MLDLTNNIRRENAPRIVIRIEVFSFKILVRISVNEFTDVRYMCINTSKRNTNIIKRQMITKRPLISSLYATMDAGNHKPTIEAHAL
jgi:hypothetical protein